MTSITRFGKRVARSLAAIGLLGLLGSGSGNALAGSFGSDVGQAAQYTGHQAENGAGYLNQQLDTDAMTAKQMATSPASVPSIQASPRDLASEARANVLNAASATNAAASDVATHAGNVYDAADPRASQRNPQTTQAQQNNAAMNAEAAEMSK